MTIVVESSLELKLPLAMIAMPKPLQPDAHTGKQRLLLLDLIERLVVRLLLRQQRNQFIRRKLVTQLAKPGGQNGKPHVDDRRIQFAGIARLSHGVRTAAAATRG